MSSAPTYNNPFSKYNANLMTENEILAYWCSPFFSFRASGVDEKAGIHRRRSPLYSKAGEALARQCSCVTSHMKFRHITSSSQPALKEGCLTTPLRTGGVGIYIRMDGALVRDFYW